MSEYMSTAQEEMSITERFKTPEVQNWVKGMLAQNITRKALRYIIEHKWDIFNSELTTEEATHMEAFILCLQDAKIKTLNTNLRHMTCGHHYCEEILNRLLNLRNFTVEPLKTDITEMTRQNKAEPEESDAFKEEENCGSKATKTEQIESLPRDSQSYMLDIAQLYVYKDSDIVMKRSLVELDISVLVELMNRCKLFSFSGSKEMFSDILARRNTWVRSPNYQFSNEETVTFINCLENVLENYASSDIYQCSDAVADLRHLINVDVYNEYNETEYMYMLKLVMEIEETSLNHDISSCQMKSTDQNTLGDLLKSTRDILEEINELLISGEESSENKSLRLENKSLKSEVKRLERENRLLKNQGSGKPSVTKVEMESVTLTWDQSSELRDTEYFQVHFKEKTNCEWSIHPEKHRSTTAVLANLKHGATYIFRIKTVRETENTYSPESEEIVTLQSQAADLVDEAEKLEDMSLAVYLLPLTKIMQNNETKIKKYIVGNKQVGRGGNPYKMPFGTDKPEHIYSSSTQTIIIFGGKGAGRGALVNSIVNYVLGVRWNDYFQFTVDKKKHVLNGTDQEEWIKCYTLNPEKGNRLTYQLQIIVIPGFSDADLEDENVIRQTRQLFVELSMNGDRVCNATICLVLEATGVSLTDQQINTWQHIQSLLGKDLQTNVCTFLLPFDERYSVDQTALTDTTFEYWFSFNPLISFGRRRTVCGVPLLETYWSVLRNALSGFLGFVKQVPPCALQSTLAILNERISILEVNRKVRSEIKPIEDFEFEVTNEIIIQEPLPSGKNVTNCTSCHYTCHDDCSVVGNKELCSAMENTGYCKKCPMKCHWSHHHSGLFILKRSYVKTKKTFSEMRSKYTSALGQF